jgi:acyl dehydratase
MSTIFYSADELAASAGRELGTTEWITVEQSRIDAFAEATGDRQWIHVDVEQARRGPFGATIAHGYLVLSLVSLFLPQLLDVRGAAMGLNYGCDRVRFPSAVRAGSRIRGRGEIVSAEPVAGGVQVKIRVTVEVEGSDKPGCVADTLSRWLFKPN